MNEVVSLKRQLGAVKSKIHTSIYAMALKMGNCTMPRARDAEALLHLLKEWNYIQDKLKKIQETN